VILIFALQIAVRFNIQHKKPVATPKGTIACALLQQAEVRVIDTFSSLRTYQEAKKGPPKHQAVDSERLRQRMKI
jgi:hypothetical protein